MPRKKKSTKSAKTQIKSGLPVFNLRSLERQAKKKKKSGIKNYYQQRAKIILDPYTNIMTVYDIDKMLQQLYPNKFKRKWSVPFTLDRKDLYKLYRSNYSGRPPFTKKQVEKHYADWVKYNYALAAKLALEKDAYSCLLRSPFFWKALYIQNLLDQDKRKTYEEIRFSKVSYQEHSKVYKVTNCVIKDLYRVQETYCMPMPKWVALRMYFRPKFRNQIEKSEKKWVDKGLNPQDLLKADPLFLDMWQRKYEKALSNLRSVYAMMKTGYTFYTL